MKVINLVMMSSLPTSLPYITARSSPEPPSSNVPQPCNIKVVPKFMFYRTSTTTPLTCSRENILQ